MSIQIKTTNSFFQNLFNKPKEKITENIITTKTTTEEIPDDIYLLISSFLKPKEIISTLISTNKYLYKLCSSDELWKDFFELYSCYLPNTKPKDFDVKTYKELFMLKTWNLSTKNKSKGIKLQKNLKTVSNSIKSTNPTDVKLITTEQGLLYGKSLIRIRFDERIYGCFIGIISKLNMKLALKSEKQIFYKHLKYMRDGSIGGVQKIFNEQIDRIREIGDEKHHHRVYFCVEKNDILSVYIDMNKSKIKFVVNDNENCMITISNVREMMLGSPIHLILGLSFGQKFTILNNFKEDLNEKLNEVRITQSIATPRRTTNQFTI